jgi:hypothetical protein
MHKLRRRPVYVCDNCWTTFEFERYEKTFKPKKGEAYDLDQGSELVHLTDEEYKKINDAIGSFRSCYCSECLSEARVKTARKNGEPDPYPVFERTLMNVERINDIGKMLVEKFALESRANPLTLRVEPPIILFPGRHTRPFSISLYYIDSKDTQDAIIKTVVDFLEPLSLDQFKITFLEAENFIKTGNKLGFSVSRGEEIIWREEHVNC